MSNTLHDEETVFTQTSTIIITIIFFSTIAMALLLGPHNKVTALSAQIGYAMNLKSVLQLKTKIKKNMIL